MAAGRAMAVASSAAMLALTSGLGLERATADQGNQACSVRLSTMGRVGAAPLHLYNKHRVRFNSGVSGIPCLLHGNSPQMAHAQPFSARQATGGVRAAAVGSVTMEAVTGIEFTNTVTSPGAVTELVLVGAGVREKQIAFLKVKVYAVGFYLDASSLAESSLGAWKGNDGSALAQDKGFFKALMEVPVEKALKIVLARDIEGSQFWGALDEALTPRLKADGAGSAGQNALLLFGKVFENRALKKGTTVLLSWSQPCTLQISISSSQGSSSSSASHIDASIDSIPLLSCLFDVYLGQDPVSPSAKASVANGFHSLF